MRRVGLLAFGLLLSAAPARADFPVLADYRFGGHQADGLHDPSTSKDPATAAFRLGDFPQAGTPCVLQAPGANGKPVCATIAGFTISGAPLQLSGTLLSFLWDNFSLTLNGGGGLQRAAINGVVNISAGNNTATYPNAGALTVLANGTGGAAPPTFVGPATVGQVFQALTSSSLGWGPVTGGSISGTANTVPFFNAAGALAEAANAIGYDPTNKRVGSRVSSGLPLYQLHLVDEAGAADRGLSVETYVAGTGGPLMNLDAAQGSYASPAAVDATKYGGRLAWRFHDGTSFNETAKIFAHVTPGATVGTGSVPSDVAIQSTVSGGAMVDAYSGSGTRVGLLLRGSQVGIGVNPVGAALPAFGTVFGSQSVVFGSNSATGVYAPGNFGTSGIHDNNGQLVLMLNNVLSPGAPTSLLRFARSRGTNASPVVVQAGDQIGGNGFYGWDGSTYSQGAAVTAWVDFNSTVTTGQVPTNWGVFSNDGSLLPGLFHGYRDDVVAGNWSQLTTNSTQGFFWITSTAGAPFAGGAPVVPQISANPGATTNAVPLAADRTNGRLYAWLGHAAPIAQDTTPLSNGFLKNTTGTGVWSVDTTTYTPTTRTAQGTAPIAIAGDHAAHDWSANRTWSLDANGVTYAFLQQGAALSIPGRAANSLGNWADISAAAGGNGVFRESGSTLGFGNIVEAAVTNLTTDLGNLVPKSRTITTTAPMTCNGSASCDLSANITLATTVFAGGAAGLVPPSTGSPTLFLSADGTYRTPAGTGGGGTVTNVSGVPGDINVATGTSTPVLSLPNVGPGTAVGGSGIAGFTLDHAGRVASVTPATYLTSTGTTAGTYNNLTVATTGLITGGARTSWVSTVDAVLVGAGLTAVPTGDPAFTYSTSTHTATMTGGTPFEFTALGTTFLDKVNGSMAVGTSDANQTVLYTNNTNRLTIDSSGNTFINALAAGGIVKAIPATGGQLGISTAADLAANQVWPAVTQVNLSSGPSTAPVGDSHVTVDISTHTFTSSAATVLGGSVQLTGFAGAGEQLVGVGNTGFLEIGFPTGGISYASGVLTGVPFVAAGGSGAMGMVPSPGGTAGLGRVLFDDATWKTPPQFKTVNYYTTSVNPTTTFGWLVSSLSTLSAGLTPAIQYPMAVAATNARMSLNVIRDSLSCSTTITANIYKNGGNSGCIVTFLSPNTGVFDSGSGGACALLGSTSPSDVWGVLMTAGTSGCSGSMDLSAVMTIGY